MGRELGYLPQPGMSARAGIGAGLGAFGKTMSDLGQLGIDDKAQKAKTEKDNFTLEMMKSADKRGDSELQLKTDELKYKKEATQAVKLQEAIDKKDAAGAFRIAHPKATENLTDAQIMAWGKDIDKLLPKDRTIDKIDTRITPDGDKILTYMDGGNIVERNMGKVKTDWNVGKDKGSSGIPLGSVAVPPDFANDHWHSGALSQTDDGRYYVDIEDRKKLIDNSYYKNKRDKFLKQKEFDNPLNDGNTPD